MSVATANAHALSLATERVQEAELFQRHGDLRPREAILAKLHRGQKWFDSGEYFLSKEGKVPNDLIPGGAPVDTFPPKLAPTAQEIKSRQLPVHEPIYEECGGPSVSDY